jgi:cellulose/xylan binding protein with CBM9 domain
MMLRARYVAGDPELTADSASPTWTGAEIAIADRDPFGVPVPGHRTEIRARWSDRDLYFLFACPYETLYLKPDPDTIRETDLLWNWDVAEVFIGADPSRIRRYKEFQVSPQGEWVDLDINRERPADQMGWRWESGMTVRARIDADSRMWYGAMKIPVRAVDSRAPEPGCELRVNLYRLQGPPPNRKYICWQPTGALNYHVPEKFGVLRLDP